MSYKIGTMASINNLPAEIICEIAKYNPGSTMKLALTCKEFNNILKKELNKIHGIVKNNNKIYKVVNELKNVRKGKRINLERLSYLINLEIKLVPTLRCINCHKYKGKNMEPFIDKHYCFDCFNLLSIKKVNSLRSYSDDVTVNSKTNITYKD
jgi:hypothetical protein